MKRLLCAFFLSAATALADVDLDRLLLAISEKETGNRDVQGRAGERTRFQILPATWRRFSSHSMPLAAPEEVWRVARAYLDEIGAVIARKRLLPTPYEYALRWNAGANARGFTFATKEYALCVQNLYSARELPHALNLHQAHSDVQHGVRPLLFFRDPQAVAVYVPWCLPVSNPVGQ